MKEIQIYTDGSVRDPQNTEGSLGGWGVVILDNNELSMELQGYDTPVKINGMELTAIKMGLDQVFHVFGDDTKVTLFSDSMYSINCITKWAPNWKKKNWKKSDGQPVINLEVIKEILDIIENKDITFKHVKSHSGNQWNELADELANNWKYIK